MLTAEQNERLTRVGPGTPGGELLRRYWKPMAPAAALQDKQTMKVRLLGEDLALFRNRSGMVGLVAELCPYRNRTGKSHTDLGQFPQARHVKIGFEVTDYGIITRRYYQGGSEEDYDWKIGHPVLFPNILKVGTSLQIRVIVDDTHTLHMLYGTHSFDVVQAPHQDVVPTCELPYLDRETGAWLVAVIFPRDMTAGPTRGAIADRTVSEACIRMVDEGEDPLFAYGDNAHAGDSDIPSNTIGAAKEGMVRAFGCGPILNLVQVAMPIQSTVGADALATGGAQRTGAVESSHRARDSASAGVAQESRRCLGNEFV